MAIKKGWAVLMGLALVQPLYAVGIGQLQLNSLLNQTFDGEVPLYELGAVSLDQIDVSMGSQDDYEKNGLVRSTVYSRFAFEAKTNAQGQPSIHITSTAPIKEPVLQLLITFTWPEGKVERTFTAFLDPEPAPSPIKKPITKQVKSKPIAYFDFEQQYGPVQAGESLWLIANKLKRPGNMTPEALMQAIYERNPKAFLSSDPNTLMQGVILIVPAEHQAHTERVNTLLPRTDLIKVAEHETIPAPLLAFNAVDHVFAIEKTLHDVQPKNVAMPDLPAVKPLEKVATLPTAIEIQLQNLQEENAKLHALLETLQTEHKLTQAHLMEQQVPTAMPIVAHPTPSHFWESFSLLLSAGIGFLAALFAMRFFERGSALYAYGKRNQITHSMNLKEYSIEGARPH